MASMALSKRLLASCKSLTSLGMVYCSTGVRLGRSGTTSSPSSGYPFSSRPFIVHNMLGNVVIRSRIHFQSAVKDVAFVA